MKNNKKTTIMAETVQFQQLKQLILTKSIKEGKIIIYPTDTIYGLGCDATNQEAIKKIREIKQRSTQPLSIIAPSKEWISKHFKIKKAYIDKLPGPFTYILNPKKNSPLPKEVNPETGKIGIRIPNHPITKMIQKANKPFITTSVNISGEKPATSIGEIDKKILNKVDLIIDAGTIDNKPSTIIDLTEKIPKIIRK
ncbi:threonylcarbamoyl-AMP synthase [Candidatus Woesearchaeota archaeon]|nr:threonylcarbamoyl-AMP synthase [Candidatus Woesearchaeota archaeon]